MRGLVILAMLVATPAFAQDPTADFEAATERALAGDEDAAIALFESIVDRGIENEDVYFNLGNVYARADRKLDAIVAYERALRLAPNDDDARKNLATVRASLVGEIASEEVPEELGLADVLDPLVRAFPRRPVAYALLAANLLLVAMLALRRRRIAAALVVATVVLGGIVLAQVIVSQDPRGVMMASVELRRGPNARYEERGTTSAGSRVRVVRETAGWDKIQNPDGTTGWLLAKHVQRV